MNHHVLISCLLMASFSFGCGGDGQAVAVKEKTVLAGGTAMYLGKPLANYAVTFYPSDGKRPAIGTTDSEGRFVLGTEAVGDGAVPGSHKVTLIFVGPKIEFEPGKDEARPLPAPENPLPAKYGSTETTDLIVEVPATGNTQLTLNLK